ncbi:MAG: phenylalanine--tRNA ligase subunit beta [Rhodocyclaceae bacterium]|nr:phenylalanine--tRNA ligase subunit beta [Rhodocyclaceae bacterium]
MKFSENWLREWVSPRGDTEALADLLTMAGLEVESLEPAAPLFSGVVVGEIVAIAPHPDADRLRVCQVACGAAKPLTIVCGAPNAAQGLKAPLAVVGAKLPGGLEIGKAKMRGVESFGMLCSAKELGISAEASGLLELPADAPVGADIRQYLDLADTVIELKLTPNRGDCLSIAGLAREVAALSGAKAEAMPAQDPAAAHAEARGIAVPAGADCPVYLGRVFTGIDTTAQTPAWMRRRIERAGQRCVSLVVDITNYVMLELGQPLHAFDDAKLTGDIVVRRANAGERIALLDGSEATLDDSFLVIADGTGAQAVAGVMGGAHSAVTPETTRVFLESAHFTPGVIAGRARRLNVGSEAAHRFERGVDPTLPARAMARAGQLLVELAGAQSGPLTAIRQPLPQRAAIRLRESRANAVIGVALGSKTIAGILDRLGLAHQKNGDAWTVTVPQHRFDLSIEEDLIEELVRVHGYQQVPVRAPLASLGMPPRGESVLKVAGPAARLALRDYQEVITYSFIDEADETALHGNAAPVRLANPIARQMAVMRSSLLAGLLGVLRGNLAHRQPRVRIFERGRVFLGLGETGGVAATDTAAQQPERLGGLVWGGAVDEQWGTPARAVDFFDVKADLEAVLAPHALAAEPWTGHPALHPGRAARLSVAGRDIGWLGELHPRAVQALDLGRAPVVFEIDLAALPPPGVANAEPPARTPAVRRDIAVVVDEAVQWRQIAAAIAEPPIEFLQDVSPFDIYRGQGIESGKKSLAIAMAIQDTRKTFTDAEIEAVVSAVIGRLVSTVGASLRQ